MNNELNPAIPPTMGGNESQEPAVKEPNWDAVIALTVDADQVAEEPITARKTKRQRESVDKAETVQAEVIKAPVQTRTDPTHRGLIVDISNGAVDLAKNSQGWSEPGEKWRADVGELLARLAMPYIGSTEYGDFIMLVIAVGTWSGGNVVAKRLEASMAKKDESPNATR